MVAANHTQRGIQTLDLNFLGQPGTIAVYLIPHPHGVALIESGPGSTSANLTSELKKHGYKPTDVTDVLLTHIHLDHAGAAGWLARQGAKIHVHPLGAGHMENPEKLFESAGRIYGDQMDYLWGEFLPVPAEKLVTHQDQEVIEIEGLQFKTLETPGHASHHFAYVCKGICFTGDIGAIRVAGLRHLRLPMPPPELNLELWRASVRKLQAEFQTGSFDRLAPTHFGVYDDPAWHLGRLEQLVDEVDAWISSVMPTKPGIPELNTLFLGWTKERSEKEGLTATQVEAFETANPSWMSAAGIHRYWRKFRQSG